MLGGLSRIFSTQLSVRQEQRMIEYLDIRMSLSFDQSDPNTWTKDCPKSTTLVKCKAWKDPLTDSRCYWEFLLS